MAEEKLYFERHKFLVVFKNGTIDSGEMRSHELLQLILLETLYKTHKKKPSHQIPQSHPKTINNSTYQNSKTL